MIDNEAIGGNTSSELEEESENGSEEKANGSDSSNSESESLAAREDPKKQEIVYEDVKVQPLRHPLLNSAFESEDTELWLVRMPRHDALRTGIEGTEIDVAADSQEGTSSDVEDRIAGHAKGYYVFRDLGVPDEETRATFVSEDATGKTELKIAKPFARSISITFDVPFISLQRTEPPPRKYPGTPKGQQRRYYPIGSSRANAAKTPVIPSTVLSAGVSSPMKKRKLSRGLGHISSPPRVTRSREVTGLQPETKPSTPLAVKGKSAGKASKAKAKSEPRKRYRRIK